MTYWTEHFDLEEILPQGLDDLGTMLHPDLGPMLEQVRSVVGPCTINDYATGGHRQWCGLRLPQCPQWSPGSMHSYVQATSTLCRAADLHPLECTAEEARQLLLKANPSLLCRMEAGVSWLHVDMGLRRNGKIWLFSK